MPEPYHRPLPVPTTDQRCGTLVPGQGLGLIPGWQLRRPVKLLVKVLRRQPRRGVPFQQIREGTPFILPLPLLNITEASEGACLNPVGTPKRIWARQPVVIQEPACLAEPNLSNRNNNRVPNPLQPPCPGITSWAPIPVKLGVQPLGILNKFT